MEVALKPFLRNKCAAFSRMTSFLGLFFLPFGDAMSLRQIYQLSMHTKISFRFAFFAVSFAFFVVFVSRKDAKKAQRRKENFPLRLAFNFAPLREMSTIEETDY
jgi:hypothetical protein